MKPIYIPKTAMDLMVKIDKELAEQEMNNILWNQPNERYIHEHNSKQALVDGIQSFIDAEKNEENKQKLIEIRNSVK